MPDLADLIRADAIVFRIKAQRKNEVLLAMAEAAVSAYGVDLSATLESTLERERLALLDPPIDFEAPDGRPADIVVLLLSPEEAGADHLKALARISRLLRRQDIRDGLRAARSAAAIHAFTSHSSTSEAA